MCCFSGPVTSVSDTRIFARGTADGRQFLVYSMSLEAAADVAMVLPIPVASGAAQDAVKFIDLSATADFFDQLENAWPAPTPAAGGRGPTKAAIDLPVEQVGAFEASFVPTLTDFARLDARFRLPAGTWDRLPQYRTHGFVVFKLKAGKVEVHPMAFSFPRADVRTLFFPTVHIHDGVVHERAHFDHRLFLQAAHPPQDEQHEWPESQQVGRQIRDFAKLSELLDPDHHFYRHSVRGDNLNRDTVVATG